MSNEQLRIGDVVTVRISTPLPGNRYLGEYEKRLVVVKGTNLPLGGTAPVKITSIGARLIYADAV